MRPFRRVKKTSGFWTAELWDPGRERWVHRSLFPRRDRRARAPELAGELAGAWSRIGSGRLPTQADAVIRAREYAAELAGDAHLPKPLTIAELVEIELASPGVNGRDRSVSTLNSVRRVLAAFVAWVGKHHPTVRAARDVRPAHVEGFVRWLRAGGKAANTVANSVAYLRAMFTRAVRLEQIERNPCAPIVARRPSKREVREATRGYSRSPEEVAAILRACWDPFVVHAEQGGERIEIEVRPPSYLFPLVLTLVRTGCRRGELLETAVRDQATGEMVVEPGLVWSRVDWTGHRITVSGKSGTRTVPLTEDVEEALRGLRGLQARRRLTDEDGHVFISEKTGRPIRDIRKSFDAAVERARIDGDEKRPILGNVRVHDLRHSCITELATRGLPAAVIQAVAGHSSMAVTERYIHLDEDRMVDEVRRRG